MSTQDQRIAQMAFASAYPLYVAKVEKKGRSKKELHQVIDWLTGFDNEKLKELIQARVTFETFFRQASLNPTRASSPGSSAGTAWRKSKIL